jgi:hypothetical protein
MGCNNRLFSRKSPGIIFKAIGGTIFIWAEIKLETGSIKKWRYKLYGSLGISGIRPYMRVMERINCGIHRHHFKVK